MTTSTRPDHDTLVNNLAERYTREGFEVTKDPGTNDVPFDLSGYRPDLVARKAGQNLIVEVKTQSEPISFDTLRSIAGEVKRHDGWHFYLVTAEDSDDKTLPGQAAESFSWDEVSQALADAETPGPQRAKTLAFLGLWVVFEKMLRRQGRRITLPIDRIASAGTMVSQLYSHGELDFQQYNAALELVPVRNQVVHGVGAADLSQDLKRLRALVSELRDEWETTAT